MGQARGIISKEELEAYGGADIMLLDGSSDSTGSGTGSASGGGTYSWEITWGQNGFTNRTWAVFSWEHKAEEFKTYYKNGTLEEYLESPENINVATGVSYFVALLGTFEGCATYTRLDQ